MPLSVINEEVVSVCLSVCLYVHTHVCLQSSPTEKVSLIGGSLMVSQYCGYFALQHKMPVVVIRGETNK